MERISRRQVVRGAAAAAAVTLPALDPPQLVAAAIGGISLVEQRFLLPKSGAYRNRVVLIVPCAAWSRASVLLHHFGKDQGIAAAECHELKHRDNVTSP